MSNRSSRADTPNATSDLADAVADVLGCAPSDIVHPHSLGEVAAVVGAANTAGWGVIPWGGGTGQDYGYPPVRADVLLDMSGLDRIVAYEPDDLVVTVEAGAPLADVQRALAARGQFLPLDPADPERATIGGILSTDAQGPWRTGYGSARDWLIGLTVVDARGRVIHGGGKVVKNVTGYDLPRLYVGALGTLGVIVEATFKVAPRPELEDALLFDLSFGLDDNATDRLLSGLRERRFGPAMAILHEEAGRRHLFIVWNGRKEDVSAEMGAVAQLGRTAGVRTPLALDPGSFAIGAAADSVCPLLLRFLVSPDEAIHQHRALAALEGATAWIQTMPLTGEIYAACTEPDAAGRLLDRAAQTMMSVAVIRAPLTFRSRPDVALWQPIPPTFSLMREIKAKLDPAGILNPGRFVGGL